jgi:plasmid stabilization system protein ParE
VKYRVKIEVPAQQDIRTSLAWGRKNWGVAQAQKWAQELRKAIATLATFPERHPIVPELEQEELDDEVRQMIFQRYRVLFTIKRNTVHVLHVRGAFKGDVRTEQEESDLP